VLLLTVDVTTALFFKFDYAAMGDAPEWKKNKIQLDNT
jgi:hypothetical protein